MDNKIIKCHHILVPVVVIPLFNNVIVREQRYYNNWDEDVVTLINFVIHFN